MYNKEIQSSSYSSQTKSNESKHLTLKEAKALSLEILFNAEKSRTQYAIEEDFRSTEKD